MILHSVDKLMNKLMPMLKASLVNKLTIDSNNSELNIFLLMTSLNKEAHYSYIHMFNIKILHDEGNRVVEISSPE